MRDRPSRQVKGIMKIPFTQEVVVMKYSAQKDTIDNITAHWVHVKYNESAGWVFSGYLVLKLQDDTNDIFNFFTDHRFLSNNLV